MKRALMLAAAIVVASLISVTGVPAQPTADLLVRSKQGKFEDVRADLEAAIIGQGLVIDFNGKIGKMLERTGPDVGSAKPIYKDAEYLTFCSAKLSRAMMEANPVNVGYCPYVMFLFERADQPGRINVGYRRLPMTGTTQAKGAFKDIEALLAKILTEAMK